MHPFELKIIDFVHQFRTPLSDIFFKFLNYFDTQEFLFVLIPIIWLGHGWKSGLRIFYILILSSFINHALKEFFQSPRPFHLEPGLGMIHIGGFGFPSGAAQTVILLGGILLTTWKSAWKWVVALTYIILISFSRIYLGVHFLTDILGGWIAGFGLLLLYLYVRPPIERYLEKLKPISLFVLSLMPAFFLIGSQSIRTISISGVAMGIGLGLLITHSCQFVLSEPKDAKEYCLRAIIGVSGTFMFYGLTLWFPESLFFLFTQFLLLGLWLSWGSSLLCRKLSSVKES